MKAENSGLPKEDPDLVHLDKVADTVEELRARVFLMRELCERERTNSRTLLEMHALLEMKERVEEETLNSADPKTTVVFIFPNDFYTELIE